MDNVVEAVECSLERGEGGRAFFICDRDRQTFREFVASIAALKGLSIEKLGSMPYWRASAIGRALDAVWAGVSQILLVNLLLTTTVETPLPM